MDGQWYHRPMRIAALQCNYEDGKTLEVADRWADMGFNTEQLFHPMADGYSSLFDPALHAGMLGDYVARAKARGLRLIVYLNVHILGFSLAHKRDEWAQQAADGTWPLLYDTYYACCFNSPWRDYFFASIDGLKAFDVDGVFLDGPIVFGGGCHCRYCRELYRRWYGGDLMTATDTFEFYRRSRDEFMMEAYRRFKDIKPQGVFYNNLPVMHPTTGYFTIPEALAYNDIVGTEGGFMFYAPPREGYMWKASVAAKVLEALAPDKPRVIFMAGDQKPWSWYLHTPAETRLCIASTVANGAGVWYGLHGATRLLASPGGQAGKEMIRFLADHEDVYAGAESGARVTVLYSYATERAYRVTTAESDLYGQAKEKRRYFGDAAASFHGFCDALAREGVPFDAVTDLGLTVERLARYDCVYLPTSACLDDAALQALRAYVARGGTLVASFDATRFTPQGEPRPDFGLADVFGVHFGGGPVNYRNWNYLSPIGAPELLRGVEREFYPAPEYVLEVGAEPTAEVLARFHGVMAGRYVDIPPLAGPAIVLNRYGQGRALYLAGTFGEMLNSYTPLEYRRLLANVAARYARPTVRVEGALGNMEVVLRRQGDRRIVHLVNYAGLPPRPFAAVAPQRGVSLRLPAEGSQGKARALAAGIECAVRRAGDELVVELPELREYEVVVIE